MANEDAFSKIRNFLTEETLNHFISEHHQELEVLRKGTSTVGDACKLAALRDIGQHASACSRRICRAACEPAGRSSMLRFRPAHPQLLSGQTILSAAILDEDGEYLGAVSVPDILRGLVRNLEANLGEGYLDNLSGVSAEELNGLGTFYASKPAASVLHEADLWMKGDAATTLMAVLREGFQIEQTRVHHRIYVCDPAKASHHVSTGAANGSAPAPTVVNIPLGSEKEGASAWVPTDVVTQLDFVKLLAEKGLAQVEATVEELGLAKVGEGQEAAGGPGHQQARRQGGSGVDSSGRHPTVVSTVTEDTPGLTAFHHMAMDLKSAVGVVDSSGKLVGSVAVADLRDIALDNLGVLLQPVSKLLADGVLPNARLDVVTPSTTFAQLVEKLSSQRLHRVYVVNADGGAQSIITLTDVLRVVSGCSIPKASSRHLAGCQHLQLARRSLDIQREHEEKKAREIALANGDADEDDDEEDEEKDEGATAATAPPATAETVVEQLQADNAVLREELASLKINKRLEILEAGLQELAETSQTASGYAGGTSGSTFAPEGVASAGGPLLSGTAADSSWVLFEFSSVKERLTAFERRAEALWHVKEGGEELKGIVDRLKTDVERVQAAITETQASSRVAQQHAERMDSQAVATRDAMHDIGERLSKLDIHNRQASEERREAASKVEAHVNSIWDQIRHVENSLSQRLTLAETSQVSTLQEVDEMKESANEVVGRLDDTKRHVAALESKLESFNTQVAAAISPLHTSLASVQVRLEELSEKKQDRSSALTVDDVNAGVARAIDHTDRCANNIAKSIAAMEERLEGLNDSKANLADVVLLVDLEALLAAHSEQLDGKLSSQRDGIMKVVNGKADHEEVVGLEGRQAQRMGALEAAILKGLRTISDKVSAALAHKLDLDKFSEFKVQVRAILADVEDRLKDWSPAARGMKSPLDGSGAIGASSCLCCDSRVRSVRDLQMMGFGAADKVLSPERLPLADSLLPAINKPVDISASMNAKLSRRRAESSHLLRSSGSPQVTEALPALQSSSKRTPSKAAYTEPAVPCGGQCACNCSLVHVVPLAAMPPEAGDGGVAPTTWMSQIDPTALMGSRGEVRGRPPIALNPSQPNPQLSSPGGAAATHPGSRGSGAVGSALALPGSSTSLDSRAGTGARGSSGVGMKVDVTTISGEIAQGRIPSTRGAGRGPSKVQRSPSDNPVAPWNTQPGSPSLELALDLMPSQRPALQPVSEAQM
ncbi:hypothetical protein QJQ45_010149 [Haematococcus lacustris]|nr:hypothetical protein QJQ45_010149 [Haematococcus lacustris]